MGAEFWVAISFVLFVVLLLYFKVPGQISKALDERAAGIKRELDEARKLKEEAQALLADYQRKRQEAEKEAEDIIAQARSEAEAFAEETRRSLKEGLERRLKASEEKIARAEAQAADDVRAAAVDVAIAAAQKVVAEKLPGDAADAMVESSINELGGKLKAH